MPVFTPGPTTSGSWPRYCRASATSTGVSGGTTLASATASMSDGCEPAAREQVAHQDAVLVRGLLAPRGQAPVHLAAPRPRRRRGPCWCCRRRSSGASPPHPARRTRRTSPERTRRIWPVGHEDEGALLVDADEPPASGLAPDAQVDRCPHQATARSRHAADDAGGRRVERIVPDGQPRQHRRRDRGRRAGARPVSPARDAVAPRSSAGSALSSRATFTPMPSTTHSTPSGARRRLGEDAGELAPAHEHVVRPLQLRRDPVLLGRLGHRDARGERQARARRPARGRRRTERYRPPARRGPVRPSRPRPPVCRSAATTVHSAAPPRARAFRRSLVETRLSCHSIAGGTGPPRALERRTRARARGGRHQASGGRSASSIATTSNASSARPSRGSRISPSTARGRGEVEPARREERGGPRAHGDAQAREVAAHRGARRRSSPGAPPRGRRTPRRRPRRRRTPRPARRSRPGSATAHGGCCRAPSPRRSPTTTPPRSRTGGTARRAAAGRRGRPGARPRPRRGRRRPSPSGRAPSPSRRSCR